MTNESDFNKFVWNNITCHIHSYLSYTHLEHDHLEHGGWLGFDLPVSKSGQNRVQSIDGLPDSSAVLAGYGSNSFCWIAIWFSWSHFLADDLQYDFSGGFLTWGYHQIPKSSILEWDFPWNKPTLLGYHDYGKPLFSSLVNPPTRACYGNPIPSHGSGMSG